MNWPASPARWGARRRTGRGLDPLAAGLAFLPLGAAFAAGSTLSRRVGDRAATTGAGRALLGTDPDRPAFPLDLDAFGTAFASVAVVLAALAAVTGLLLIRLRRIAG